MEYLIMKLLAFYLPQFHEIPENNDAWGKGFTEWDNVRKAKSFFTWQKQPKIPMNNNYYNLLDVDALKWQANLAHKYGIDGFCIYHYWFNGKLVLEKPVQKILEHKDIPVEYCFSWANESWTKTWHGARGAREILISQSYGREEEWEKHYQYFRPYFKDIRYIKEKNCPILLIYRLRNIPQFNQMIKYWNQRAREDGFDGIYLISMNVSREHVYMSKFVNASVDFEPNKTKYGLLMKGNAKVRDCPCVIDYQELYENMLIAIHEKNYFRTVFVNYDDTPRRGSRGLCIKNVSQQLFKENLLKTIQKSKEEGNNYVFINAWNEWGEGNYLEPDEENGYAYLEAVKECKNILKTQ